MARRTLKIDRSRRDEYRVVGSAEIRERKLNVDLVSAYESPHGAPIASLRGYVGSEYLFRVLGIHKEGLDTIHCWEIIYSLSEALRKAGIIDAAMYKSDVIEVVSTALGVTRQRARRGSGNINFQIRS